MAFSFTDEQEEFRSVVRRFLEEKSPPSEVRRLMKESGGCDPAVWRQLSQELGLSGVHIPEEYGGQGFGFVELGIVLEERGRSLLCAPYFASAVLGAGAIRHGATETRKKELLPTIASGETIATLAFTEASGTGEPGRGDAGGVELTATPGDGAFRLDGVKTLVLDGHTADLIVVVARRPGSSGKEGVSLFTVAGNARGLERRALQTIDATRKQARLAFSGVQGELLGELDTGSAALLATLDDAAVALANESVGAAQFVLETAVEYAKTRVQFGRPIGSFQAIKHKCADLLLEIELAKSAAYFAASAAAEKSAELPELAALAKAMASDTFLKAAAENIQIHGGVGFTWEYDAHLYFRRAKASEVFLGDPTFHRERYAQYIGMGDADHGVAR
jgi:alkylation response protein AidB-like acyl-CoA dehydrogenase